MKILSILSFLLFAQNPAEELQHLERMVDEHRDEAPVASPAVTEPAFSVFGREVRYGRVDEKGLTGYLAKPVGTDSYGPALIVIHEWWGLNDNIERMADKFAGEGYAVLAVDLYRDQVASDAEQARSLMQEAMAAPRDAEANIEAAIAYLQSQGATSVGVLGWCFGGGWALRTALLAPEAIDAAVMYYGRPIADASRLGRLEAPLLGHFGSEDRGIPVEKVKEMQQSLAALDKDADIVIYEGANHAFANPSGDRYDPEAADAAWERTLAFLNRHLRGDS